MTQTHKMHVISVGEITSDKLSKAYIYSVPLINTGKIRERKMLLNIDNESLPKGHKITQSMFKTLNKKDVGKPPMSAKPSI
jgi:hypothetical protein